MEPLASHVVLVTFPLPTVRARWVGRECHKASDGSDGDPAAWIAREHSGSDGGALGGFLEKIRRWLLRIVPAWRDAAWALCLSGLSGM